jgi:hypothetical protein
MYDAVHLRPCMMRYIYGHAFDKHNKVAMDSLNISAFIMILQCT